jgi:hypothetical protein
VSGVTRGPDDDPAFSDEGLLAHRERWFDLYTAQSSVVADGAAASMGFHW